MSASAAGAPAAGAKLPRQVKLFGAVSLLNDFASEMIYPLLPALVTGGLGAGPQGSGVWVAARTRSRRGRARPARGLVAPRLGNRERAHGDRVEHRAGGSGAGARDVGGKGR